MGYLTTNFDQWTSFWLCRELGWQTIDFKYHHRDIRSAFEFSPKDRLYLKRVTMSGFTAKECDINIQIYSMDITFTTNI
jgi:hypothetical protein